MEKIWDAVWLDVHLATMEPTGKPYGAVHHAAIAVKDGCIAWLGPHDLLPGEPESLAARVVRGEGCWVTPGLIDCHTHLVFGGNRAGEFERRLQGVDYATISREGGGINATVKSTRAASEAELLTASRRRLERFVAEGVTTIEIKSGYGLDTATELKMLRTARALGEAFPLNVHTTFLGAHAIPPEFKDNRDGYVDLIINEMLPEVAASGLADAVDAFCETIGFSYAETERIFTKAKDLGLPLKLHADQLSDGRGAALAAEMGALSADHLEYTSEAGAAAMGRAGTTAVLLPGAFYVLRETQLPPFEAFAKHGVPIALASDCNPGSSPIVSLQAMLNMACTLFRMTPEQALAGITRNAARALGVLPELGTLTVGKRADMVVWDIETPAELSYWLGANPLKSVIKDGLTVREN